MAVKTKEELFDSIKGILADDTSDASLALLEDVSDTLEDLTSKNDSENWKQKYEDNDKEWRKKYRDRFFNTGTEDVKDLTEPDVNKEEPKVPVKYEDLFTVKE